MKHGENDVEWQISITCIHLRVFWNYFCEKEGSLKFLLSLSVSKVSYFRANKEFQTNCGMRNEVGCAHVHGNKELICCHQVAGHHNANSVHLLYTISWYSSCVHILVISPSCIYILGWYYLPMSCIPPVHSCQGTTIMMSDCTIVTSGHNSSIRTICISNNSTIWKNNSIT